MKNVHPGGDDSDGTVNRTCDVEVVPLIEAVPAHCGALARLNCTEAVNVEVLITPESVIRDVSWKLIWPVTFWLA